MGDQPRRLFSLLGSINQRPLLSDLGSDDDHADVVAEYAAAAVQ